MTAIPMDTHDRARVAHHEASHALACVLSGVGIRGVSLEGNGHHHGVVDIDPSASARALLKVTCAGIASDIAAGIVADGEDSDITTASRCALAVCKGDEGKASVLIREEIRAAQQTLAANARAVAIVGAVFMRHARMSGGWVEEAIETALTIQEAEAQGMKRIKLGAVHRAAEGREA